MAWGAQGGTAVAGRWRRFVTASPRAGRKTGPGPAESADRAGEGETSAAAGLRSEGGGEALLATRTAGDGPRAGGAFAGPASEVRGEHGPVGVRPGGRAVAWAPGREYPPAEISGDLALAGGL